MKKIVLEMSQIIELLNGRKVETTTSTEGASCMRVSLSMHHEDTSITKNGAIERIRGEWEFTLNPSALT